MSRRYGGTFSPTGSPTGSPPDGTETAPRPEVAGFRGRKPLRHGAKINLLFALALLPLITAFFQPVAAIATDLAGMAALLLAAWLTRDGVRAEDAYAERKVARRPAIPRKILGAVLMGLGVALLVFGGQWAVSPALLIGMIAGGLHLAAFGLDPLRDKGMAGLDRIETDRIARKIDEAEQVLSQMTRRLAAPVIARCKIAWRASRIRCAHCFVRSRPIPAIWPRRGAILGSICRARATRPCNSPNSTLATAMRTFAPITLPFLMIWMPISPSAQPQC